MSRERPVQPYEQLPPSVDSTPHIRVLLPAEKGQNGWTAWYPVNEAIDLLKGRADIKAVEIREKMTLQQALEHLRKYAI